MPYTLQEIITERFPQVLAIHVDEISAVESPFSAARCLAALEQASKALGREMAVRQSGILDTDYDFTVATVPDNTYEYPVNLPSNFYQAVRLNEVDPTTKRPLRALRSYDVKTNVSDWNINGGSGIGAGGFYRLKGRQIVLLNPLAATYRMIYQRSPGRLCYGAVASATSTSLTAGAVTGELDRLADAYVGDQIAAISASGVVQIRTVTDYVATTGAFTIDTAWDTTPTSAYTFSILPFLADADVEMLVYLACSYFGANVPERAAEARGVYESQYSLYVEAQDAMDFSSPHRVIQDEPGLYMPQPLISYPYGRTY